MGRGVGNRGFNSGQRPLDTIGSATASPITRGERFHYGFRSLNLIEPLERLSLPHATIEPLERLSLPHATIEPLEKELLPHTTIEPLEKELLPHTTIEPLEKELLPHTAHPE